MSFYGQIIHDYDMSPDELKARESLLISLSVSGAGLGTCNGSFNKLTFVDGGAT